MKTLEEAIDHAKAKAIGNDECAVENEQLATWLCELRARRNVSFVNYDDATLPCGLDELCDGCECTR